ncbi:hypothetical protein TNIN_300441 [Trichonephila inaurata madagascariensis]|uniref:Uncharacterized protein n=1 Tax=Trichonephila inaurata madagascariensis TaxID=2747483 RepID=A0A8X6X6W6_9ARAC|nr:hypothetical protein TNIN_300441 [Trichonephila inaurata madagascariensis]
MWSFSQLSVSLCCMCWESNVIHSMFHAYSSSLEPCSAEMAFRLPLIECSPSITLGDTLSRFPFRVAKMIGFGPVKEILHLGGIRFRIRRCSKSPRAIQFIPDLEGRIHFPD